MHGKWAPGHQLRNKHLPLTSLCLMLQWVKPPQNVSLSKDFYTACYGEFQPRQHTKVDGAWTCDYCDNLVFNGTTTFVMFVVMNAIWCNFWLIKKP